MSRLRRSVGAFLLALPAVAAFAVAGCSDSDWEARSLDPVDNPFPVDDPQYSEQPTRAKPLEIVVLPSGDKAYVSLQGTFDHPGHEVAVVDLDRLTVNPRIAVGSSPTGLALHPQGRFLVVFNRLSNYVSVIDTTRDAVVDRAPIDFYATEGAFTPDGTRLFVTNRFRDAVSRWAVEVDEGGFRMEALNDPGVSVRPNPRDIAVSPDGRTVAAASVMGVGLALIDVETGDLTDVDLRAPANGVAFAGDWVIVPTLSASTHHQPFDGPDVDGDGMPGDGTPNVNFQDLQNEIAVLKASDGSVAWRYTSDTICCYDYRDVDPVDAARYGDHLPPRETWIVGGSLPEQVAVGEVGGETRVFVTYSASNQVGSFRFDHETGALSPLLTFETRGHGPHGVALAGDRLLVTHRLSETLGVYDATTGEALATLDVGDLSGGAFPATDAEIGELVTFNTADYGVDGDQSCQHCHREMGNIDKVLSMPLTRYPGMGLRMTQACRGAADTRPWFFESAMDQTNFRPVTNEFARIENFCCDDYTLWPSGSPADCETNPPPECATETNASSIDGFLAVRGDPSAIYHPRPSPWPSREMHFLNTSIELVGRSESLGDGVFYEDPITRERSTVKLDFDGITRALGVFLLMNTNLPPNPNDPDSAAAQRGKAIFEDRAVGCSICHPAPSFAISEDNNPFGVPLVFGPVITPVRREEDGVNLDLLSTGFIDTFPTSVQEACEEVCDPALCAENPSACDDVRNVFFGATTLKAIWDRAPRMLHDGRAQGLREVLCTPGHPALQEGETGFNERDGAIDTHGATSHLSTRDIEDLIAYLLTL